ncbi:MAG: DNA starvation/stationary phase protection protein Dps, partial [Phycisphaerales bacterium]
MHKTHNDLSKGVRKTVMELLAARLCDAIDLQTQCKQAHWNVRGSDFIALHELFDKVNEAVEDYVDEIAERIAQLGGIVHGTARVAAKKSTLKEYPLDISKGEDHVEAL